MTNRPNTAEDLIKERNETVEALYPALSLLSIGGVSSIGIAAGLLHLANSMLYGIDPAIKETIILTLIEGSDATLEATKPPKFDE